MKRLTERLFGLQRGERGTALLLAGYHFLLLLCLYLLKPVRDGQFLTDRGTAELPIVFMLVTAATIPASLFHRWLGQRFQGDRLTNVLTIGQGAVLLAVSALVWTGVPGSAYAVYVYVSIYGVLATSQFWLFAGELLTSAQSKRAFSLLNLGGILGAIAGGELTGWLLDGGVLPPSGLLAVTVAVLAGTLPLVIGIRHYHEQNGPSEGRTAPSDDGATAADDGETDPDAGPLGMLRRLRRTVDEYPLVGWIAALVGLLSMVSTVLDYQFKTIASAAFASEASLTAFLGHFYGRVSLVALGLQLLLSTGGRRYIRSTSVLWVLPVALALGTTALFLVPGLAAVTLLRGTDQSLKHSLDKTGRELLFLPLPDEVKRRLKVPLDLGVDQLAYGLGGLLLLGLVSGLGVDAVPLGGVVLGLVAVWCAVVYGARRAYLQQFRDALDASLVQWGAGSGDGQAAPAEEQALRHMTLNGKPLDPQDGSGEVAAETHSPAAERERGLRHGGRYLVLGQLLALRTGAEPPDGAAVDRDALPREAALRRRRQQALDDLFEVFIDWLPEVEACSADDLRLALAGLRHEDAAVRSDAVALLDGVLSGTLRRRLVPLLNDPDGRRALEQAPPLYRFALAPTGDGAAEEDGGVTERTNRGGPSLARMSVVDSQA
jgi:ATP/ADP translocase